MGLATGEVLQELLSELATIQRRLESQLADPEDRLSLLEGHKWILTILQVASDVYVWGDTKRPRFVEIVGPYKKWGGDNADAFYHFAPIDPARHYRVTGRCGDAAYISFTVYGGPDDGRYSERIVGMVNDRQMSLAPDGTFQIRLGPEKPVDLGGASWIQLEPDAVCAITRDYLDDPLVGRRAQWQIEALDPPAKQRETDADLARRMRAALTFVREQAGLVPLALGEPNTVDEPYPVPKETFGWAAGDAAYAMGSFDLEEDQALVIAGRSPECAFWNMCLWNPFLSTFDYDYERVTINGKQAVPEADGSWTIVVAPRDPYHPNWVSTAGHRRGRIWFRWFLPARTPQRPQARVVASADVPKGPVR